MSASGARSAKLKAAAKIAGAVFLPSGSIRISAGEISTAASCSVTTKRKSDPVRRMGGANPCPTMRCAELWNKLYAPISLANCLG